MKKRIPTSLTVWDFCLQFSAQSCQPMEKAEEAATVFEIPKAVRILISPSEP